MKTIEKQQLFYNELKELLLKYKAEIKIEDVGISYHQDHQIVIDFEYDEELYNECETGVIPSLILGHYENGDKENYIIGA